MCPHSCDAFLGEGTQAGKQGGPCFTPVLASSGDLPCGKQGQDSPLVCMVKPLFANAHCPLKCCQMAFQRNKSLRMDQPRLLISKQASYMDQHYRCAFICLKGNKHIWPYGGSVSVVPLHLSEPLLCIAAKDPPRGEFVLLSTEVRCTLFKFSLKAIKCILRYS